MTDLESEIGGDVEQMVTLALICAGADDDTAIAKMREFVADHDRQQRAQALREAADELDSYANGGGHESPYRHAGRDIIALLRRWAAESGEQP